MPYRRVRLAMIEFAMQTRFTNASKLSLSSQALRHRNTLVWMTTDIKTHDVSS